MEVHIYAPPAIEESYRVLPKRCRTFHGGKFGSWRDAFEWGLIHCGDGYRVFHQRCCEWHEPLNTELVKVDEAMSKEAHDE